MSSRSKSSKHSRNEAEDPLPYFLGSREQVNNLDEPDSNECGTATRPTHAQSRLNPVNKRAHMMDAKSKPNPAPRTICHRSRRSSSARPISPVSVDSGFSLLAIDSASPSPASWECASLAWEPGVAVPESVVVLEPGIAD